MKKTLFGLMTAATTLMVMGCGKDAAPVPQAVAQGAAKVATICHGPGYFFIILFVVVPLFVILVKLFRESEATSDSLISLEGQLRRLNNKIDDLEAGIKGEKKAEK